MKILLLSLVTLFTIQVCTAQSAPKARAKPADSVQFVPPVIKKDKPVKKKSAPQFTQSVIVKDKS